MTPILTNPSRLGVLVHLLVWSALALAACLYSDSLRGEPVASVDGVEKAITWLIREAPNHRLNRNSKERREWAVDFVDAGRRHRIDPYLLAVIAKRESTFRQSVTGGIGEKTCMQILPSTARSYQCDVSTRTGSIDCAALILRERLDACGTIQQALAAYASRGKCSGYRKSATLRGIADSRLKKAAELRCMGEQ
jgi:soluble lytic murein transglycosylase-like protein